ncbi:MAG: hypothetical protein J6A43_09035, partial [Clostridia bacterium]|nr:hypothetical protein [Clostridia bacterium]
TINNVEISNDVFTYFLDLATVEMGKDASFDALREKAKTYASTYFKTSINGKQISNNIMQNNLYTVFYIREVRL